MPKKSIFDNLKWLDPFTYVELYVMPLVNPKNDKLIENAVYILSAFLFAYILYNFILAGLLGTTAPLVIVYSGSMEPNLYRGDVVILTGSKNFELTTVDLNFPVANKRLSEIAEKIGSVQNDKYGSRHALLRINGTDYFFDKTGPVVVYHSSLKGQDIIHRAVLKLHAPDGDFLITFGDNNPVIDQDCQGTTTNCITIYPIPVQQVKGQEIFHIPLIGYVKLLLFDDLPRLFLK